MYVHASVAVIAIFLAGVAPARSDDLPQAFPLLETAGAAPQPFGIDSAGEGTTRGPATKAIFLRPQPNLSLELRTTSVLGKELFEQGWHPGNAFNSAEGPGLGPLFNASTCETCHRRGGRGPLHTVLLRLSIPPETPAQQAALDNREVKEIGDPIYGIQLQERAVPRLPREGGKRVVTREIVATLSDGTTVILTQPTFSFVFLNYGPLHDAVMLSARLGPPIIGLGLLESVASRDIEALADPDDADGDGISGRPNYVRDPATGQVVLGRFGWKAGVPSLRAQTAAAFSNDIGVSTSLFPAPHGDCTAQQTVCLGMAAGVTEGPVDTEAPDIILDQLTQFVSTLGVPARRNADDPEVLAGQRVFVGLGCGGCHTPTLVTSHAAEKAAHRSQRIWPYTDLLLHDMGEGLADHRPEGDATGFEWRTPPLWGIGLTELVFGGKAAFLHDGRAPTLTAAILWHGGEAQAARETFASLSPADREALLAFLTSL